LKGSSKKKKNEKVYEFFAFSVDEISPLLKTYFAKKSACVAFFATFCFQAFLRIFFFDFDVRFWEPKIIKRLTLFKSFCINALFVLVKNLVFSIFYIVLKFFFLFFVFETFSQRNIFLKFTHLVVCENQMRRKKNENSRVQKTKKGLFD
jgi:hypothetical protein